MEALILCFGNSKVWESIQKNWELLIKCILPLPRYGTTLLYQNSYHQSFVVNKFKNPEKYKSKIQSQGRLQSNKIMFTCLTILLLSLPYIRKREPQFFTCGCSSCRIFWEANCFPTLLFLPVKIIMKMRQFWHVM